MSRINHSLEYDDIRHKRKCDEEQHKKEHNDDQHKRKKDEKQHKKEHNDDRHKRKKDEEQHKKEHNDDRHKRKKDEEHHKKEHNNDLHKRKHLEKDHDEVDQKKNHDKNYFIERDLFNFFKTFIAENNNYVPLDNNLKDKNRNLSKEDDLENNVEDENCNLTKQDGLENNVEDKNCNLSKEDDLENNVEDENCNLSKQDGLENNVEDKNCNLSKEDDLENNVEDENCNLTKQDGLENNVEDKNCNLSKEDDFENNIEDENCNLAKQDGLENNIEDKNCNLFKEDDLENNIEDENCNLSKEDGLENDNYTCFEDLYNEEFLEEKYNTIAKEELSKETYKNQVDEVRIMNCKTTVISETLPLCENITHTSEVTVEPVTVKIPVVLTECTVTITIESSLKLEDVVLEIKHIRKNVYLNQCELIPNSEDGKPNTGILFIDGFISKNIEYTTKDHNDNGVSCGMVKHATVKVPFKCTTRVTFKTHPKFKHNTHQDEMKILQTSIKIFDTCEEDIIGGDIREQSFKIMEYFNEKVFCELISAEIVESDILENPIKGEGKIPLEQGFHDITEKVVLSLTIKLLQNQHVDIAKKD
ncbi:hypothetical protein G9F72_007795 [Clostridium estertheticum]|uniref:CsxC family protein n=1 Tax=Clostridium estertheticum TaxID=238834 RepID=UPI0013E9683E|nr:hypothetical protein [Clostridium estertheticum]MBZ9686230.1 hypothetical protein [Clostridium estertheticum]